MRADAATRELYACDAGLYRRRPRAALRAGHVDDLPRAVAECARLGLPLTMRGAGTSLAGQSVGEGLVVDTSALGGIEVYPDARRAVVEPGAVLDSVNAAALPHGLVFGADVATGSRATLGGMIANNSAGARSLVYGLTADNVEALEVVLADGTQATLRRGADVPAPLAACAPLSAEWRGPTLQRRVSGYALDALAGDAPDWPRLVCGSEGTLAVVTRAHLRLEPLPPARGLALVPFASVDDALGAVVDILATAPSAVELMDRASLDPRNRPAALAGVAAAFADAGAMLLVEYQGDPERVREGLAHHAAAARVEDATAQAALWTLRRAGLARALRGEGLARVGPDDRPIAFIEDPAVPPERLATFAREVRGILDDEGVASVWFGHAGVGCLHIRPLMDLRAAGAVARMVRIAEAVADRVVAHHGSLSGEHGDGRVRSALLGRMYPPATMDAFRRVKELLDPEGILNPGVIVDAEPLDRGLRVASSPRLPGGGARRTALSFAPERGLGRAAEACNGNGACRARSTSMCPSFQALGDERHSTRGRTVLLRAALEGRLAGGLADPALHEALDLCLACTACRRECPASVDMAALKSEALAHRRRAGREPVVNRVAALSATMMAMGARAPRLARAATRAAGALGRRVPPAPVGVWRPGPDDADATVVVFADTFTRHVEHDVGDAALAVLRHGRERVAVVAPGCCGRPLMSQGHVGSARRRVERVIRALDDGTDRPIVVLEPSCASMLVHDAARLTGDADAQRRVAGRIRDITDLVGDTGRGEHDGIVTHVHCHADTPGARARLEDAVGGTDSGAGCCGMAGAWGYLHPAESRAVAAQRLLPAVEGCDVVVAPGFSCRCQVRDLAGVPATHPAQALRDRIARGDTAAP